MAMKTLREAILRESTLKESLFNKKNIDNYEGDLIEDFKEVISNPHLFEKINKIWKNRKLTTQILADISDRCVDYYYEVAFEEKKFSREMKEEINDFCSFLEQYFNVDLQTWDDIVYENIIETVEDNLGEYDIYDERDNIIKSLKIVYFYIKEDIFNKYNYKS